MFFKRSALVLIALLLAGPVVAKERTWTYADGRQMVAEFVRELDGDVTFLKDGKLVTVPLDQLSKKDQQIVRDLSLGKPLREDGSDSGVPAEPVSGTPGTSVPSPDTGSATGGKPGSPVPSGAAGVAPALPGPVATPFPSAPGSAGSANNPSGTAARDAAPVAPTHQMPNYPSANADHPYECSRCKRQISEAESHLDRCPYCGTYWIYRDHGSGSDQYADTGISMLKIAAGFLIALFMVVLAFVSGFIGALAATVRAVAGLVWRAGDRRW